MSVGQRGTVFRSFRLHGHGSGWEIGWFFRAPAPTVLGRRDRNGQVSGPVFPEMTEAVWQAGCCMVFMVALLDPFTDEIMRFAWTTLLPLALLAGIVGVFFRAAFEGLLAFLLTTLRKRSLRRRTVSLPRSAAPAE